MKKAVETMIYLSSLLPTASTKVSAMRGNVRKALLTHWLGLKALARYLGQVLLLV